jgi:phage tail-like protein
MAKKSGRESDPLTGFTFRLEIEGKISGYFTEVSGLGSEHEVIDHKVVDDKGRETILKIPGRLKWGDISLKRGITDEMDIWEWRQKVVDGKLKDARTNCSIVMLDRDYEDVARWDFKNAWPSKVSGPNLKADSNDLGIEELVLVHEGIVRKN